MLGLYQLLPDGGGEKARQGSGFIKRKLFQLLPDDGGENGDGPGPVYQQLHDGDNEQYFLYRWDINCICRHSDAALHAANKYLSL